MRAFVVEDEPEFRNALAEVLESVGWTVNLMEDGIAALGWIHRTTPDLITLDISMPNLGGLPVLRLLRSTEVGQRIPVIVITGKPPDDSVRDLASLVLVKPLEVDEMMQAISTVMNARTRDPAARASGRVMAQPT